MLSLEELELIETLTPKVQMSQLLLAWKGSAYASTPLLTFYLSHISKRRGPANQYVLGQMDEAMSEMRTMLFPDD